MGVVEEKEIQLEALHRFEQEYDQRVQEVNYTRNEWRRCKTILETSGEDVN